MPPHRDDGAESYNNLDGDGGEGNSREETDADEGAGGGEEEEEGSEGQNDRNEHFAPSRSEGFRGTDATAPDRLVAAHAPITLRKFLKQGKAFLSEISKRSVREAERVFTKDFALSDSDDEPLSPRIEMISSQGSKKSRDHGDEAVARSSMTTMETGLNAGKLEAYPDDDIDEVLMDPTSGNGDDGNVRGGDEVQDAGVFPRALGFGRPIISSAKVIAILDARGSSPLYCVMLDCRRLRLTYTDARGLPVGYVFHRALLKTVLAEMRARGAKPAELKADVTRLLQWLACVARAPLPEDIKQWFFDIVENPKGIHVAPHLKSRHSMLSRPIAANRASPRNPVNRRGNGAQGARSVDGGHAGLGGVESAAGSAARDGAVAENDDDINLIAIAANLARAYPIGDLVGRHLVKSIALDKNKSFLTERSDAYGCHVVTPTVLENLQSFGISPAIVELGHDSITNAKDNASMYMAIISQFSDYRWIVYVRGLLVIPDALLKWVEEFTAQYPWRFVYFENSDTSWNFSEMRDRLVLTQAPRSVSCQVSIRDDLKSPAVRAIRPSHSFSVVRHDALDGMPRSSWDELDKLTRDYFTRPGTKRLASWKDVQSAVGSGFTADFREEVRGILIKPDPCVVLLVSAPGAGKSHFSDEISQELSKELRLRRAWVDGSNDELLDTALITILSREIPLASSGGRFLIVDEYHMLSEAHKRELFSWLAVNGRRLHVLLIANRTDATDEKLLSGLRDSRSGIPEPVNRVRSIQARLGRPGIESAARAKSVRNMGGLRRWFHCARSLFGGEAISLRFLSKLDSTLGAHKPGSRNINDDLVSKLMYKLPLISRLTAEEFVDAFVASLDHDGSQAIREVEKVTRGPVGVMFQAALLTENSDVAFDFPDFVIAHPLAGASEVNHHHFTHLAQFFFFKKMFTFNKASKLMFKRS